MAGAWVSASFCCIFVVLLALCTTEIKSAQKLEPVTTQLQSHTNVKDAESAAGSAVLYQSSRVAATSRLDSGRPLTHRRGRRPPSGRRRVFVDTDETGRRAGARVRVGSYFDAGSRFAGDGDEEERRLFSWNEAGRRVPLRRRLIGSARRRLCVSDGDCEGHQLLPPIAPAAVRHQPGTTYDRRGVNSAPRSSFSSSSSSSSSSSASSSSSENQLSRQPGSTVITRYPHRTVYRNASGTYVRQMFGSPSSGFRYHNTVGSPVNNDLSTVFNHTVITQHRVVSHSRGDSGGSGSNFSRSSFSFDSSPSTSATIGGGVGGGALNQISNNTTQSLRSTFSSSSSSFTNSSRHFISTDTLDRISAAVTPSGSSSGFSDHRHQYEEHTTAQLREAYIKRNRIQQFGVSSRHGTASPRCGGAGVRSLLADFPRRVTLHYCLSWWTVAGAPRLHSHAPRHCNSPRYTIIGVSCQLSHVLSHCHGGLSDYRGSALSNQRRVIRVVLSVSGIGTTCERGSCLPSSGNLLVGRKHQLHASSTCGLRRRERYCIVSNLEDQKSCYWCDSRQQVSAESASGNGVSYSRSWGHTIDQVISATDSDGHVTWWQAENGREEVYIQLDLEAEFHFTHLIIKFRTFRPKAMLIERSYDRGNTWHVYRYFAENCGRYFPGVAIGYPRQITDVTCQQQYSRVEPSELGEVIFRALPPRLTPENPYSDEVQNLLKITNLRVNFTRLHTLGDDLLDHRLDIQEKYYYAVYEMYVGGRCSCYGHAPRCLPLSGPSLAASVSGMVHGRCDCIHNTDGLNCQRCRPFYHDLPWRPAVGKVTNACQRCNCHEHSDSCHFDEQRYNETGFVSGGVCQSCQHNTTGPNCERCLSGFYQDPALDITHPNVCKPCQCSVAGSVNSGLCQSVRDTSAGLEAGECTCKQNVIGANCDSCRLGFWNFSVDNPLGCQECLCDPLGSREDTGCDIQTGQCQCKRYVIGERCDACAASYWALGRQPEGCRPCHCDPGGALNSVCDPVSGQCSCRANLVGRTCNEPQENFYGAMLDFLVYEAEQSEFDEQRTLVVILEPSSDPDADSVWTGLGFVQAFDGSQLQFGVDNILRSLDYDVVIRYQPQTYHSWPDVRVTVLRDLFDPVDLSGQCAVYSLENDRQLVNLTADSRFVTAAVPVCLERGKKYGIRLEFPASSSSHQHLNSDHDAGILIDSVVLIPRVPDLPSGSVANELRVQQFEKQRCAEYFYPAHAKHDLPSECRQHLASIGFFAFEGAKDKACECDPTGSESALCDPLGGQCRCKVNVAGRRCETCRQGTFGFSPNGCTACECNAVGSLDNLCDPVSGQCGCRASTYGRRCDRCQSGHWNYPQCERCQCHGHATTCHQVTGHCISCREDTAGTHCQRCVAGYYGDPRLEVDIACRPCQCPGTNSSGHWFAESCQLDPVTHSLLCHCQPGYTGARCDQCDVNHYGRPQLSVSDGGSLCRPCQCNNNVDLSQEQALAGGYCNTSTGHCTRCLFNTTGIHCERCADGYHGDAVQQTCQECKCNMLGTDPDGGPCDPSSGQCHCLPNVMGLQCDRCVPHHWKIAVGSGCEPCRCDPAGSVSQQCNEYDGQCQCRAGFGGRRCDQCEHLFWGDPRRQCRPCECDALGSAAAQCERETGRCRCRLGIGGVRCDQCARGYHGQSPECRACGECFDNWDSVLVELRERTDYLVSEAGQVKQGGSAGAYRSEFDRMEQWLVNVEHVLGNATVSDQQIDELQTAIEDARRNVSAWEGWLRSVEASVDNTTHRLLLAELQVPTLAARAGSVTAAAAALRQNATHLQEANVDGALALTREAQRRSKAAEFSVLDTERTLEESERQRRRAENLLDRAGQHLNSSNTPAQRLIDRINSQLSNFERQMPDINNQVCDGSGDPCDALCGGAGCGKCGGLSCDEGAVTRASNALSVAEDAAKILTAREREVDELLRRVSGAKLAAENALQLSLSTFGQAERSSNRTLAIQQRVEHLLSQIDLFLAVDGATPQGIRDLAQQVLDMSISLRPEQITQLARQINETISSLTNIDSILLETADDLALAGQLKARAAQAKLSAEAVLTTAESVMEALDTAAAAQSKAELALTSATQLADRAETELSQVDVDSSALLHRSNVSLNRVLQLQFRHKQLLKEYSRNELNVNKAVKEAGLAAEVTVKAESGVEELETSYQQAAELLATRSAASSSARARAQQLLKKANQLAFQTITQLRDLTDMSSEFSRQEELLVDLSEEVDSLNSRMTSYLQIISERVEFSRNCQAV